jgi:hypothetical protein
VKVLKAVMGITQIHDMVEQEVATSGIIHQQALDQSALQPTYLLHILPTSHRTTSQENQAIRLWHPSKQPQQLPMLG